MTNHQRFARLGRGGCVLFALTIGGQAASGGEVPSSAYFSLEGDINAVGDQYDFTFDLTRSVSSAEDLRFLGLGDTGTTNAAGDSITNVNFDSDLHLYDSLNALRGQDDESGPNLDALLTWAPTTIDTPLNPDPLPADSYRLNIQEYSNNNTGPFAVDLIGPADALVFTGGTPVAGGTVRSLKFGTDIGIAAAVYNHSAASGTFTLQDQLVVAQTGGGILNLSGGTITVGGLTTIKSQGSINQTNGTLNTNGGLTIDAGIYTRTAGTYNNPGTLTVQNGGLFQWDGNSLFNIDLGSSILVTGTDSTLRRRDLSAVDNTLYVQNGVSIDATLGGKIDAEYLWIRQGTVTVDGVGSTLDVTGGDNGGYTHEVGGLSGVSTLTLSNDATGSFDSTLATTLYVGPASGSTASVNVLTGADLTVQSLSLDGSGTGTVTVNGSGSTITQSAGSALTVGSAPGTTGTLNVENSGVFNASHTGTLNINATGILNVNSGGLFNVIPPNAGTNQTGTAGGTLTIAGTVNVDSGTLRVLGGRGGNGNISTFVGATGGVGGSFEATGGTVTVSGTGVLSAMGGRGGNGGFSGNTGGKGGVGGNITVNGASVAINDSAILTTTGGTGGTGGTSKPGGKGGDGGTIAVTSGSLTLNDGLVTTIGGSGGAGGPAGGTTGARGAHGLIDVTGGTFEMNGGEVFTGTFQRSGGGIFNHNDGKLTVSGGTFDPGTTNHTIDGPSAAKLPTLVLDDGATAPGVTGDFTVGDINRGRFELLNGATLNTTEGRVGNQASASGEVLVDGNGSIWDISGGNSVVVGEYGTGEMTVSNGGAVNAGNYLVVGRNSTSDGTLHVNSGGSVSATNLFVIAEFGTGVTTIGPGGAMTAANHLELGRFNGANGTLNVDGLGAVVNANTSLNVGGRNSGAGGTGELTIDNDAQVNVTNVVRVWGGGTANLSGGTLSADTIDHTHGGTFDFLGGTLHVETFDGTLDQQGGTLAPGFSAGKTVINGGYGLTAGTLEIELGGTTAGVDFDQVEVLGNAQLFGDLDVSLINGFVPSYGDSFLFLLAWGGVTDAFSSVSLPAVPVPNAMWNLFNDGGVLFLNLDSTLAGDLNNDGFVGIEDLNLVLGNWNQNVTPGDLLSGDPTGDGFVGIEDLNQVLGNWNNGTPPPVNTSASIPEPASGALLILGAIALGRRKQQS